MAAPTAAHARTLLQAELSSRRIKHPLAVYNANERLICTVCRLEVKHNTQAVWENHLRSEDHARNVQKLRDLEEQRRPQRASAPKKRKAEQVEDDENDTKRPKGESDNRTIEGLPERFFDENSSPGKLKDTIDANPQGPPDSAEQGGDGALEKASTSNTSSNLPAGFFDAPPASYTALEADVVASTSVGAVEEDGGAQSAATVPGGVDEDEWAAFEREVVPLAAPTAISASADFSAPALSATELAALSAADSNALKKQAREAEMEAEKEDAARRVEEELEEMESLEQRVRRLREKREALRNKAGVDGGGGGGDGVGRAGNGIPVEEEGRGQEDADDDDDEDEDEDEDEAWDDWRFSRS